MSGVRDKLTAVDDALGIYTDVQNGKFLSVMGDVILYNPKTNRLVINGILIMVENGRALLNGKQITFEKLKDDQWHLKKEPIRRKRR